MLSRTVVAVLAVVVGGAYSFPERLVLLEEEQVPLAHLHAQNKGLISQIQGLGGKASPLPSMPALPALPTSGGGAKAEGIKEALAAVKPVMDKYVNTAKVLAGKYATLKKAYDTMKSGQGSHHEDKLKAKAEIDKLKRNMSDEEKASAAKLKKANVASAKTEKGMQHKIETLIAANAKLTATNQEVSKSFMSEIENARKAAHAQVQNLQAQLERFMSDSNKEQFDAMGKATAKALEEKETLKPEKSSIRPPSRKRSRRQ